MDVEVPPVQIEDGPAVHHLAPLERTEHLSGPSQLLERADVDLAPVVHGEVPIAVRSEVAASPGPSQVHSFRIRNAPTGVHHHLEELVVGH